MREIIPPGRYLGQITSGKRVGAQNWKCPNRDMEKDSELRNNWQRLNMLKATEVIIYTRTKLEGKQIIAAEKMR